MLTQHRYIEAVTRLVERDARVSAALMYGSFTRGDGDAYSDVEFYVFMPAAILPTFDAEAWCSEIASVRHSFSNEFGTFVVVFDSFIRGEFHFVPEGDVRSVAGWIWEALSPEDMVLKDETGELRAALEQAAATPHWTDPSHGAREESERLLNWLLVATNAHERGEPASTLNALSYAHRFLLRGARLRSEPSLASGKGHHWLNPAKALERRADPALLQRYARCTSTLDARSLAAALRACWMWGLELSRGLETERIWKEVVEGHSAVASLLEHRTNDRPETMTADESAPAAGPPTETRSARDHRVEALAGRIAERLREVDGVTAVVIGGSRASGLTEADSDLDIGIYYEPTRAPSMSLLERIGTELQGRRPCEIAPPGSWGPWMNGGSWLEVDGVRVDWIFRDLARVRQTFEDCTSGHVTCDYYLGHPHGFHNHYYLAEVHYCEPIFDATNTIETLARRLRPFPARLRQALIEKYLYDAGFMLDAGEKGARRGDTLHSVGCIFRCAAAIVQVAFALNERFTMNEKKSLQMAKTFSIQPASFAPRLEKLLGHVGTNASQLQASYRAMRELLDETRSLAPPLAYSWPPQSDASSR